MPVITAIFFSCFEGFGLKRIVKKVGIVKRSKKGPIFSLDPYYQIFVLISNLKVEISRVGGKNVGSED
jgi:hypothetical protein